MSLDSTAFTAAPARRGTFTWSVGWIILLASGPGLLRADEAPTAEDAKQIAYFEAKIRPVLVKHCYKCHSVAAGKAEGGLQLDSRKGIRAGGDRGPAVVPGDPAASLLL